MNNFVSAFSNVAVAKKIPARDLCESRSISCQSCMCTGRLQMGGAAVMVGVTEVAELVPSDLQRLTHVDQCGGQTCQTGDSEHDIQEKLV